MSAAKKPVTIKVYQLKVALRAISPLIWRRLLVTSDMTIAQLHDIVQIAMGWEDLHLHQFRIHGKTYGIYRNGERISTAFTESTINQVVSKRMVKKQQMQWTPEGAHLLLQVRTQVLNEDWEATFRRWYPRFRPVQTSVTATREAA